jgi:hypothetical protein
LIKRNIKWVWKWRSVFSKIWQSFTYLITYGFEVYRYKYGLLLDSFISMLYDYGLIYYCPYGMGYQTMFYRSQFRLSRSLTFDVPVDFQWVQVMWFVDPSDWKSLCLVSKLFCKIIYNKRISIMKYWEKCKEYRDKMLPKDLQVGHALQIDNGKLVCQCAIPYCSYLKIRVLFDRRHYIHVSDSQCLWLMQFLAAKNVDIRSLVYELDRWYYLMDMSVTIHVIAFVLMQYGHSCKLLVHYVTGLPMIMFASFISGVD